MLPYVVTLRSAALAYQSARRKGEQPDPRQLAASLLSATQEKMNRWPVASVLPTWLDARLSRDLLTRLGVDPSLHEKHLIEWLSEPAREMGCNFPCADSGVDLPA